MSSRIRRSVLALPLALGLAVAIAGCGPSAGPSTSATPASGQPAGTASPGSSADPSPVISVSPVEPGTSGAPPDGQSDTEWGRIWDQLPPGFPNYPGATIANDASSDAVSGRFAVVGADPADIAAWLQQELEMAAYSTEALSGPLEDGSFVLDSVGEGDCRVQTTVAPRGRLVFVAVRYGAACPVS